MFYEMKGLTVKSASRCIMGFKGIRRTGAAREACEDLTASQSHSKEAFLSN